MRGVMAAEPTAGHGTGAGGRGYAAAVRDPQHQQAIQLVEYDEPRMLHENADYARDVAVALRELAPDARMVVGMSLGGLTALALAAQSPELVRKLVLVDVTPGVNQEKGSSIAAFINGPASFPSFDEILARTIE